MQAPAITFEVASRFHGLRRRYLVARLMACAGFGCAAFLLGWLVLTVCDFFWELPLGVRQLSIVGLSVMVVAWVVWETLRTASESRSHRFVSRLERQFESLGQRLRTLLETVEGKLRAPEAMLSALGHQTLGRWETAQPTQVIPQRLFLAGLLAAGAMMCAASAAYLFAGDEWRAAMLRSLGYEIPYTRFVVTPGNARLLEGSLLSVQLELQGRADRDCRLRYRDSDSQEWIETSLQPSAPSAAQPAQFVAELGKIKRSVEYQFITSVGATQAYVVTMQPLIKVEDFSAVVTPPAYTHLPSRTFSATEVSVLEGSQVNVTLETNHPLNQVQLDVLQSDKTPVAAEAVRGDNPLVWNFVLPSSQSLRWQFTGAAEDGTPMNAVRGRLNVRRDQPPRLEWQEPPDELTVHMLAEVPMQVQVSDDYGVGQAGIVFQLGDEDEFVLQEWPAEADASTDSDENLTTRARLSEVLPLESFALSEKDFITYYAFAVDNRTGSPQHVESEVRYIDIRPLKQYFFELEASAQGGGGNRPPGLDEVIRRQRYMINRTRSMARSSPTEGPDRVAVIERLVEGQSELADLTRFMVEFLISQGNDDTESLSQAEAAMLQAVDSIATADFDSALIQEQDALRFLAEARRSLDVALARNRTAQQRQALNRFRREMQQKLRRNLKQSDEELADTLDQVAKEQGQLAKEAQTYLEQQSGKAKAIPDTSAPSAPQSAANGEPAGDTPSSAQNLPENTEVPENNDEPNNNDEPKNADEPENSDEPKSAETPKKIEELENADAPESVDVQLHGKQQELFDRLAEIDAALSPEIKRSELVTKRLQQATSDMDELVTAAQAKNWADMATRGKSLGERLRELASHVDALAAGEPVKRVSAARDMTTSLANMEGELSNVQWSVISALEERAKQGPEDSKSKVDELRAVGEGMSTRMRERAATLADLLVQPLSLSDLAGADVHDQLVELAEQHQLNKHLTDSRSAAMEPTDQKETSTWADAALNRGVEYADIAAQLDALHRQLVAPRLDNLRQLEAKANALARALDEQLKGKGGGGKPDEKADATRPGGKTSEMQQRELEQGLIAAGLEELAEELRSGDEDADDEKGDLQMSAGSDAATASGAGTRGMFSIKRLQDVHGRVIRIDRQLQEMLRDLILSDTSADKNMPVPPQYKELVDRYFRSISEGVPNMGLSK